MNTKKSLQKFTENEAKINNILSLDLITPKDLEHLNKDEYSSLMKILSGRFNELKGMERDKFYKKIEPITSETTKNQLWENNHSQITWAISALMQENGRMPSKTEIANKIDLSRQTVHKHLKEYANHPEYLEQIEQFRFMTSKVLAKVFQFAVNGDIGAAKLYFNIVGFMNNGQHSNNTLIQNQNNYIQINGTVLSQETIKHLNPEQLNTIETILKTALPQPEVLEVDKLKN
jgi:predicted transcriptional regulator